MVILEIIQAPPYIILIGLSFKILALIRTYVNLLFIVIKRFSVMQLLARVISHILVFSPPDQSTV